MKQLHLHYKVIAFLYSLLYNYIFIYIILSFFSETEKRLQVIIICFNAVFLLIYNLYIVVYGA